MSGDGQNAGIGFGRCGYGDAGFNGLAIHDRRSGYIHHPIQAIAHGEAGLKGDKRRPVEDL